MKKFAHNQLLPITLTLIICSSLIVLLWLEITLLNHLTTKKISLVVRPIDILIGMTIYLKTSIDFAIYIGRLMSNNNSLSGRIAIELGTAIGNAAGTMIVLALWIFFKDIHLLLAIMIILAALVLFKLAEEGLEHVVDNQANDKLNKVATQLERDLNHLNRWFAPLINRIIPQSNPHDGRKLSFWPLLALAISVPFILGLDDFAGYVPLFNIVNVFGFAIGVFIGHMILNICLYLSPRHTIAIVKNRLISLLGSVAFIGLAIWGLVEAFKLLAGH